MLTMVHVGAEKISALNKVVLYGHNRWRGTVSRNVEVRVPWQAIDFANLN